MADLKAISDSRTALLWFKPERIKIKPELNGRDLSTPDNVAHVADIAASIEAHGFMQSKPLEIFSEGDDIYLSDGHVRYAAVQLLLARGVVVEKVPCVPEPRGTNDADRILNQTAHNSGKRLSPLEEGRNIKRAMALAGLSVAEVAKRLGKSITYVNQALDFQAAPAEVHAMVKAGKVSATLAAKIVRKEGGKATETLNAAVETSHERGKARATEKDIAGPTHKRPIYVEINHEAELRESLRDLLDFVWSNFGERADSEYAVTKSRSALARADAARELPE